MAAETTRSVTACVLHGAKDLRIESRPLSPLASNEVTVRVSSTGLCGSDLHYYNHNRNGDIIVREPLILGHESVGYVTAVGADNSSGLQIGDFVALEVGIPCGTCALCAEGRYNICSELRFRSSAKSFPHFQGTLQSEINHLAERCYKLPSTFPPSLGALIEPLSVALHAVRRAALPRNPSTVLILGAGPLGLLCAAVLRAANHRVVIADLNPARLAFATTHRYADASHLIVPAPRGDTTANLAAAASVATELRAAAGGEIDAVFECTGAEACLQAAILSTRPGGRVMLIGMGTPVQTLPISAAALREVDLVGVFRYAGEYAEAIALVDRLAGERGAGADLPDLEKLVSHRFTGLPALAEAFACAGSVVGGDGELVMKVVVDFSQE